MPYNFVADGVTQRNFVADFCSNTAVFRVQSPPTILLSCTKQDEWSFMPYKNVGTTFFRFVTNHAFNRPTERWTDTFLIASPRRHFMQRGKNLNRFSNCYRCKIY